MTLRLTVVGSSHVSAFRHAWTENPGRWPGFDATFFAVPHDVFRRMVVTDDLRLVRGPGHRDLRDGDLAIGQQINGCTEVDLSDADLVLAVGMPHLFDEQLLSVLDSCDVDGLRSAGAPRQMSAAAFAAILEALVARSRPGPGWFHPGLRGRLTMAPRPQPSQTAIPSVRVKFGLRRRIVGTPQGASEALARYVRALAAMLAADGIRLFPQPPETMTPDGLTLERFTRGFRRIQNDTVNERDHIHANAAFGALCLDRLLAETKAPAIAATHAGGN